jgi:hypothetical protein
MIAIQFPLSMHRLSLSERDAVKLALEEYVMIFQKLSARTIHGLVCLMLLVIPPVTQAQLNPLQDKLAAATRLECHFSLVGKTNWDDDTAGIDQSEANLEAVFFDIDVDEGTAEAQARFGGASYIIVRYSTGYLHLIQTFRAGPLYVTSVLAQETADGRMMAVQNRVEYTAVALPGFTSRPETYVGDCAVS